MFKNISSLIILLVIVFAFSNPLRAQSDTSGYGQDKSGTIRQQDTDDMKDQNGMQSEGNLKTIMQKMHTQMKESKLSGDPEKDFANLITQHHQGAIRLSQMVINNGKNEDVKRIAQEIVDNNTKDLAVLQGYSGESENAAARSDESGTSGTERTETGSETGTGIGSDTSGIGTGSGTTGMSSGSGSTQTSELLVGLDNIMDEVETMTPTGDIDKDYASLMILHHEESIKLSENFISKNSGGHLTSVAQDIIDKSKEEIEELQKFSSR